MPVWRPRPEKPDERRRRPSSSSVNVETGPTHHPQAGGPTAGGRTAIVVGLLLVIALIHVFRVGSYLRGSLFELYYGYFSDIVIPFGVYFLLCVKDASFRWLRHWYAKALLVFVVASAAEVMQAFGVPLLGRTFDPLDFVMFGAGVLLAAFVDRVLFARIVPFWSRKPLDVG